MPQNVRAADVRMLQGTLLSMGRRADNLANVQYREVFWNGFRQILTIFANLLHKDSSYDKNMNTWKAVSHAVMIDSG